MTDNTVVYITGSGHSGSTLLDMCLGGHDKIASLGETGFLYFYAHDTTNHDICTCGEKITKCPFWSAIALDLARLLGAPEQGVFKNFRLSDPDMMRFSPDGQYRDRLPHERQINANFWRGLSIVLGNEAFFALLAKFIPQVKKHREAAVNRRLLFQAVFRALNCRVVVNSTKTAGAVKEAYMERRGQKVRFIELYRDGRGVAASHMRRMNIPMEVAARHWRNDILKWKLARLTIPDSSILTVHYEDFARDPEKKLRDICAWLEIDYQPLMLDFRANRHNLGGNQMRFRTNETKILLDERWRRDLTAGDLKAFDQAAGWLNKQIGYTD